MHSLITLFVILIFSVSWATTYRWVDEKGTEHFTEDYGSVPERYKAKVKEETDTSTSPSKVENKKSNVLRENSSKGSKKRGKAANEKGPVNKNKIESDAAQTLKIIISLWKDEKYDSLYDYGTVASKTSMSKEKFVQKMKRNKWGLAPSWETVQDVEPEFKSSTLVYVTARIGHKPKQGRVVRIERQTFQMKLEKGEWKIDLSKVLSSSGGSAR